MYTWENIPKNQIDDETIEQAINRLILAHENKEDAHLGVGQSLQSHKASEIIDHLAQSILYNNISARQLIYSTNFENPASFSVVGSPTFKWPGFSLSPDQLGFSNRQSLLIDSESAGIFLDFSKNFILQFSCFIENLADGVFRFQSNAEYGLDLNRNVGLLVSGSVAKFFFSTPTGTNTVWLDWEDFEQATSYVVRIDYIASEEKAYFYVNDVLIGSLSIPSIPSADYMFLSFSSYQSSYGHANASISGLVVQLSV